MDDVAFPNMRKEVPVVRRMLAALALLALIFAAPLVGVVLVGAVVIAVVHDRHGPVRRQATRVIGTTSVYAALNDIMNFTMRRAPSNRYSGGRWSGVDARLKPIFVGSVGILDS